MFIKSILKNVMAASVVAVGGALVYKALENPKILSKAVTVTDIALDKIEELQDKICNRIDDLAKDMADTDDEDMDDEDMDDEDMDDDNYLDDDMDDEDMDDDNYLDDDMDDEDMDDDNYLDDDMDDEDMDDEDMDDDNYLDDDMDDEDMENGGINDEELADTDKLLGDTTEDIFDKISKMSKSYRNDEDTLNRMLYGDANKADK